MIPGYPAGQVRDRPAGGGYLWRGSPWLDEVNREIIARRSVVSAEAARREALRARDIPAACICPHHWSVRCDWWVRTKGRRRQGCPCHRQRGGGGA